MTGTNTPTDLRHRVTHLVPPSVRRLPYQAADRAVAELDTSRLRRARPDVFAALAEPRDTTELRTIYDRYIADVSRWDWAVSWPTARALDALCNALKPRRILDLGSGFSTLVMARAVERNGGKAEITSVDDSPEWLDRTRAFLTEHDLSATLVGPSELPSMRDGSFDLAFDDIGRIEERAQHIPTICRVLAPGGVVVLDDMNVRGYRGQVRSHLQQAGWPLYSLRKQTVDAKRRFSMLTVAP